jgi:hypothetical protein
MNDDARTVPAPQPDAGKPTPRLPWFTADEIPLPPPEMRRPPEEREPTLFDDVDDG